VGHDRSQRTPPELKSRVPLPYRIVVVQASTAVSASLLLWWKSAGHALGAMTAAVVVLAPSAWFAWRVVSKRDTDAMREAQALLGNSVARLVATCVLMGLAIVWLRPEPFAFFGTLIAMQVAYWFVPLTAGPPRSRG
jgi:F0F1-type ATP synthase assembly protein I